MNVESLTDQQLREQLQSYGQDVPPVTSTTRKTLEKRLKKLMASGSSPHPGKGGTQTPQTSSVATPVSSEPQPIGRRTRQTPDIVPNVVPANLASRTPSPPLAPLPRAVQAGGSPRKTGGARLGAAFSSDESEDDTSAERRQLRKPGLSSEGNATTGTPLRGYLNGQLFGSRTGVSSTDSSSGSRLSGFGRWFGGSRDPPRTSTPQDSRGVRTTNITNSFGAITPIRDEAGGIRHRPLLSRPSLETFSEPEGKSSAEKRGGFFNLNRFIGDPIHLTPQQKADRPQRFIRHSPPKPRPLSFLGRRVSEEGSWARYIQYIIFSLALLFFLTVGALYFYKKWESTDIEASIVRFQLEGRSEADNLHQCGEIGLESDVASLEGRCYTEKEIIDALHIAAALSKHLAKIKGEMVCGDRSKAMIDVVEARSYALEAVPRSSTLDFSRAVDLIVANPHWGISGFDGFQNRATSRADVFYLESDFATKGLICRLKEAVATLLFKVLLLVLVGAGAIAVLAGIRYFMAQRAKKQTQVFEMVDKIIGVVRKHYEDSLKTPTGNPNIPLAHVRETLLPHGPQRNKLMTVWDEAVKYIAGHESRIHQDFEQRGGEDYDVWRWVPTQLPVQQPDSTEPDAPVPRGSTYNGLPKSTSPGKTRLWGGGANQRTQMPETVTAVTPCLKVRGMFIGKNESQTDLSWVHDIEDAILDKCLGVAQILDMRAEPASDEGIVYIKLATNNDARNAYLALHGQYFDKNLINVKFLKLERYHMRFPDAEGKKTPLQSSKHSRNKLYPNLSSL